MIHDDAHSLETMYAPDEDQTEVEPGFYETQEYDEEALDITPFGNCCGAQIVSGFPEEFHEATYHNLQGWLLDFQKSAYIVHFAILSEDQTKTLHSILLLAGWRPVLERLFNPVHKSYCQLYIFEPTIKGSTDNSVSSNKVNTAWTDIPLI